MPIKIVLELGDDDLAYYRRVMEDVWKKNAKRNEKELVDGARRLLKQATKIKASPEYIKERMADLAVLVDLLDDPEWPLTGDNRKRIVSAVGYFAVARDMIPDKIPGIGFLDDAIMAELTLEALKHDLQGYRDFCKYRDNEEKLRGKKVSREDWLEAKRRQIFMRIERRQRESRRHASRNTPMNIFHY